jgi:DNA helicase-2/ATP-dependent DNA helicase PcrA
LIRHNLARRDKDYQAVAEACGHIVIRGYDTPEDEARQVAVAIRSLLNDGFGLRQIAVLYRSGSVGLPLQAALKAAAIPFEVRGSGDLWHSRPAMLAVGALHYLLEGRSPAAMSHLGNGRRAENIIRKLDDIRKEGASGFADACGHVRRIVGGILPAGAAEREQREWTALLDAVLDLAQSCASLGELERRIAEQSQALRDPPEHAVVLSTVHSAKGLEWDAVFVVGLEEDVLPNVNADDVEEERRVAYVALTRSKRLLGLTYVAQRYGTPAKVSRFVKELHKAVRMVWSGPEAEDAGTRIPLVTAAEQSWLARIAPAVMTQMTTRPADPPKTAKRGRVKQARRQHDSTARQSRKAKAAEKMNRNRTAGKPARYGLAWSPEEEARLTELFEQRRPLADLAEAVQRSEKSVLGRLSRLGFLDGDDLLAAFEEIRQQ